MLDVDVASFPGDHSRQHQDNCARDEARISEQEGQGQHSTTNHAIYQRENGIYRRSLLHMGWFRALLHRLKCKLDFTDFV